MLDLVPRHVKSCVRFVGVSVGVRVRYSGGSRGGGGFKPRLAVGGSNAPRGGGGFGARGGGSSGFAGDVNRAAKRAKLQTGSFDGAAGSKKRERDESGDGGERGGGGGGDAGHADKRKKFSSKSSQKPNADLMVEAKQLWETARLNNIVAEQAAALARLHELTKTKIVELIHKHDASRIVETMLKRGTVAQVRGSIQSMNTNNYCCCG